MENLVEIFANTLDAILGIVFLTMILGKKKSMPNWLFVVLALIVPVANVVLQKVFPDSPENNIVYILLTIFFGFVCTNGKISEKIIYVAIWNILLMVCGLIFASVYGYVVRGTNGMEGDGCDTAAALHHGFEAESDPVHASGHGDPEENEDEIRDAGHECCRVRNQYFDRYYLRYYAGLPVS